MPDVRKLTREEKEDIRTAMHERLSFCHQTGIFTWKYSPSPKSRVTIGDVAGGVSGNYWKIKLLGRLYPAHHLAWLWMTGEWPTHQIDHIDLNKINNRWANLRAATNSQNQANTRLRSDNTSGFKGVFLCRRTGRMRAQIKISGGKGRSLGGYNTAEEASAAYMSAMENMFGEFSRPR